MLFPLAKLEIQFICGMLKLAISVFKMDILIKHTLLASTSTNTQVTPKIRITPLLKHLSVFQSSVFLAFGIPLIVGVSAEEASDKAA